MNLIKAQLIEFLNKYNALFSWLFLDNWNLPNNQNHLRHVPKNFQAISFQIYAKKLDLKSSHFPGSYISEERSILGLLKTGHIKFPGAAVSELWASKEDQVKA